MDRRALLNAVGPDLIRAAEALDLNSAPDAFVLEASSGFSRLSMQPHPGLFLRALPVEVAQLVVRRILDPEGTTRRFIGASLRALEAPEVPAAEASVESEPATSPEEDREGAEDQEQPVNETAPTRSGPAVLTLEEVAEILRVKPATARRLLRDGELPGRKVGRDWRVRREELESYLRGDR